MIVPEDAEELPAELARHGARPGQRVRVAVVSDSAHPKPKSVGGLLEGRIPQGELLSREDFEATHRGNVQAAERRFGVFDR